MKARGLVAIAAALMFPAASAPQQKGGLDETGPYEVVENWFKPVHAGHRLFIDDVLAETSDRILVVSFGETAITDRSTTATTEVTPDHFVVVLDGNGNAVEEWKNTLADMVHPHAVKISPYDPDRHVWIVDREGHQILKYTHDGKRVVMRLGEKGVAGADRGHFNRPADLAFLPDGSLLVADGYAGTRVVKFDAAGRFVLAFGAPGRGPGQFSLVHCVAVDARGRIYVADRNNSRVQVFDAAGVYLDQWPIRRPNHLLMTDDQFLWLSDGAVNRFAKFDLDGRLQSAWGVTGTFPGAMDNPHKFSVDPDGNLYVADYANNRVQKFRPRAGADRSRLIGRPYVRGASAPR